MLTLTMFDSTHATALQWLCNNDNHSGSTALGWLLWWKGRAMAVEMALRAATTLQ
jgi:hypothetical protein